MAQFHLSQNNKVLIFLGFLTIFGQQFINHFNTTNNNEKLQEKQAQHADTLHSERYYSEQEILGAVLDLKAEIKDLKDGLNKK